jgi:hypothetical protein
MTGFAGAKHASVRRPSFAERSGEPAVVAEGINAVGEAGWHAAEGFATEDVPEEFSKAMMVLGWRGSLGSSQSERVCGFPFPKAFHSAY